MKSDKELKFHKLKITRQVTVAPDVFIIYTSRPFEFSAGQVCGLKLNADDPYRLYSIATGEKDAELGFLYNINPDGLLTPRMANSSIGRTIFVSDPTGSFIIPNGPATLIATGTGVAPFISAMRSEKIKNKVLIQGARTIETLYARQQFVESSSITYIPCCSKDHGENIFSGRLTKYLQNQYIFEKGQKFYLCGSPAMVVTVRELLINKNVPFENILSEIYF